MELHRRLEQILVEFRPAFSRSAAFAWFVVLIWAILLNTQGVAVTSYVNALGLGESYYPQVLHWFHATSFQVDGLSKRWARWLAKHAEARRLKGALVYVGDGIKVSKEGRKMPGVKRLHQESSDVSKPEWIRGHYFSALCLLLGKEDALFATPISFKLHDGIEGLSTSSLVDKMTALCVQFMAQGSYALLDAYFATAKTLREFRQAQLHLITRVRSSTTARAPFSARPGAKGRGRPRQWGSSVKLSAAFVPLSECESTQVWLYGEWVVVHYQQLLLHWDSSQDLVLFVLTQLPSGARIILLSSDTSLTGAQVIEAYGWRFKIEVTFRTLWQLLEGFAYRFWLGALETAPRWPTNLKLQEIGLPLRAQVLRKVEAFERFVNLNAIALGLLQVLAIEMPQQVWQQFPGWLRTTPKHGYPSEQIVLRAIQAAFNQRRNFLGRLTPLLLDKFLAEKVAAKAPPNGERFAA